MAEASDGGAKKEGLMSKLKKLAGVLFIVLNVAVSGAGLYFVFLATIGFERPAVTEEEELKKLGQARESRENRPIIFTMDKFTVNLEGEPKRIIQTEISLEMLDENGFEEVVVLGAQARDSIVKLLNAKTFTELETIQGKLFLKDQISQTLNQLLKSGVVKNVYFSEFIVQ